MSPILFRLVAAVCLGCILAFPGVAGAQSQDDPHGLYEIRCGGCHAPHAGDFVFDSLTTGATGLVGVKTGLPVRDFLASGHGRLSDDEIDRVVALLQTVFDGGHLFRDKCLICHDRAVVLARTKLIVKGGVLTGRYTGRDIPEFLKIHGRLTPEEVPAVARMLERQLSQ
ncbi:hypothetical protein KUH32_04740 [Thalassococcus sp. CAU 1522]|uniref:Cytochrome c domain-containing protein n=1 Tax=Thalassococcus arenae TaxID=2851652 RepID=A0ABS6N4Y6_9RHOB|nr:hypothetical protein [Thalassococcus arenae]MBV2359074.1 hypothetical protein [Thalassococcus arenae]